MSRFASILDKKIEDTPPVPLAPAGSYIMMVSAEANLAARGEFEILEFSLVGVQPVDDTVDMEELTAFGGAKNVRVRHSFLFPTDEAEETKFIQAENNLKKFLYNHLGITESEAPVYKQALALVKGRSCIAEIDHRQDKNNTDVFYAQVKRTMAVE